MTRSTQLIAAIALGLAATGTTFAQEAGSDAWMQVESTKSRAQVQAELAQARADGSIKAYSAGYIPALKATQARAEIMAATLAARASGELARIDAEAWHLDGQRTTDGATRLAGTAR